MPLSYISHDIVHVDKEPSELNLLENLEVLDLVICAFLSIFLLPYPVSGTRWAPSSELYVPLGMYVQLQLSFYIIIVLIVPNK